MNRGLRDTAGLIRINGCKEPVSLLLGNMGEGLELVNMETKVFVVQQIARGGASLLGMMEDCETHQH